jgi:hypothetical protein
MRAKKKRNDREAVQAAKTGCKLTPSYGTLVCLSFYFDCLAIFRFQRDLVMLRQLRWWYYRTVITYPRRAGRRKPRV